MFLTRMDAREQFTELMDSSGITVCPGIYDGISANVVESVGFETASISGAGVSNSRLGKPDVGFLDLTENVHHARHIVDAVDIPVHADADTGYGNAMNVYETVDRLEQVGVASVMLEDQEWPKRCGHMEGKSVIPFDEAVSKIEAAVAATEETDPDLLIKARTDAAGTHDIDEAVRRLNAFAEAGADIVFADALLSGEDIAYVCDNVSGAAISVNMGFGIRSRPTTPLLSPQELKDLGVDAVIYPRLITAAATMGMEKGLKALSESVEQSEPEERPDLVVDWDYYMDVIGRSEVTELEERFAETGESTAE